MCAEIADVIVAASFAIRQSETILCAILRFFEIANVLVCLDHVARFIIGCSAIWQNCSKFERIVPIETEPGNSMERFYWLGRIRLRQAFP
jgi:hypothetical protein